MAAADQAERVPRHLAPLSAGPRGGGRPWPQVAEAQLSYMQTTLHFPPRRATRDIAAGEVVLTDTPIMIGMLLL